MPDATPSTELTLLLIDDDLVSREVVSTMLSLRGAVVHSAEDGASALHLLDTGICSPSLILMDARMPGMSGEELLAALRARCPARIVLISASNPSAELCAAADSFLLKPFGMEELDRILSEHQEHQHIAAETSGSTAEQSDLDMEALQRLRGMMPESAVREIYSALLADLDRRMDTLQTALTDRDSEQIRRIGHAIKGGAAMSGAICIARLGAKIEVGGLDPAPSWQLAARDAQAQIETVPFLFVELRDAVARLRRMLVQMSLA